LDPHSEEIQALTSELMSDKVKLMEEIGEAISSGAEEFLHQEYLYMGIFIFFFTLIIFFLVDCWGTGGW
jgi:Na+/H+-translocating membrane pyrophosphatase